MRQDVHLNTMRLRPLSQTHLALTGLILGASFMVSASTQAEMIDQLIVKYQPAWQARRLEEGLSGDKLQARIAADISAKSNLVLTYKRPMSAAIGTHVLSLPYAMSIAEAQRYADQIARNNPSIAYVEPDSRRYFKQVTPSDPLFTQQWYLATPEEYAGAANVAKAWELTKGSAAIVVGVLDSGVTNHVDLRENLVGGTSDKSGYDFITRADHAFDGDGRDADPTDPGVPVNSARQSEWHGTQVAGIIAAVTDNARDIAGIGWRTRLLNVRVLSEVGGSLSDQVDGMLWAAGEDIAGVPRNPNPAQILNLSVGTNFFEPCSRTEQAAIQLLNQKGVSVVVAAGNENRNVEGSAPANCQGVIAVTGVTQGGARAAFANFGAGNALAAPAESIISLSNAGMQAPLADNLKTDSGTSQAAPMVAATLALMLAANEQLRNPERIPTTDLPALLLKKLQQSARPFPSRVAGAASEPNACNLPQEIACVCTTATCGAGLLDVAAAVRAVSTPPVANISAEERVGLNRSLTISGAESSAGVGGKIVRYQWVQESGNLVELIGADTADLSFITPTSSDTLGFKLTVTNDVGLSHATSTQIQVRSGRGGSMDVFGVWVLMLLLAWRWVSVKITLTTQ